VGKRLAANPEVKTLQDSDSNYKDLVTWIGRHVVSRYLPAKFCTHLMGPQDMGASTGVAKKAARDKKIKPA
jgi:hypothetical protein